MQIEKIGIVGAGQMGNGIAHVCALAGYEIKLNDISQDALDAAITLIKSNLKRQVSRDKISEADQAAALARVSTTVTLGDLGQTDLIIEAATERETVKAAIFEELLPHLQPHTILTSNTSSIHFHHPAGLAHGSPGKIHGVSFHEPGAGDATG